METQSITRLLQYYRVASLNVTSTLTGIGNQLLTVLQRGSEDLENSPLRHISGKKKKKRQVDHQLNTAPPLKPINSSSDCVVPGRPGRDESPLKQMRCYLLSGRRVSQCVVLLATNWELGRLEIQRATLVSHAPSLRPSVCLCSRKHGVRLYSKHPQKENKFTFKFGAAWR